MSWLVKIFDTEERGYYDAPYSGGALPVGTITEWSDEDETKSAPVGWLYCDGSLVEKEPYEALYDVISDTYDDPEDPAPADMFRLPTVEGSIICYGDAAPDSMGEYVRLKNSASVIAFGIDEDGKWGYRKMGADTVTPFSCEEDFDPVILDTRPRYVRKGKTFLYRETNYSPIEVHTGIMDLDSDTYNIRKEAVYRGVPFMKKDGTVDYGTYDFSCTARDEHVLEDYTGYYDPKHSFRGTIKFTDYITATKEDVLEGYSTTTTEGITEEGTFRSPEWTWSGYEIFDSILGKQIVVTSDGKIDRYPVPEYSSNQGAVLNFHLRYDGGLGSPYYGNSYVVLDNSENTHECRYWGFDHPMSGGLPIGSGVPAGEVRRIKLKDFITDEHIPIARIIISKWSPENPGDKVKIRFEWHADAEVRDIDMIYYDKCYTVYTEDI